MTRMEVSMSLVDFSMPDEPAGGTGRAERRATHRQDCLGKDGSRVLAGLEAAPWLVTVRNLSAAGMQVEVNFPVEADTEMMISLFQRLRGFQCRLPGRVVYRTECSGGSAVLGVGFRRCLSDAELHQLLPG